MSKYLHTIDPEFNFWKLYPELKKVEEFKKIQKDFSNSSDVMWFIVQAFDTGSKFFNMPQQDRVELLGRDYLKDKDFYKKNQIKLNPAIVIYEKLSDTPFRRHYRQWMETIEKRTNFLREMDYDLDNFDKYDKMATNTTALLVTFEKLQAAMEKQEGSGTTKSNAMPSLADSEEI